MPIHDQGYRRYGGDRAAARRAWLVIAKSGIRTFLRRRPFIGLLLGRLVPVHRPRRCSSTSPRTCRRRAVARAHARDLPQFLEQQNIFVFFITVYVGAGLIANDRRANALQIYLSKPLTRPSTSPASWRSWSTFLLLVTWVPAMLLLIVQILFAGNFDVRPRPTCSCSRRSRVFSFIAGADRRRCAMLALSSLSKSSRYVAILYRRR